MISERTKDIRKKIAKEHGLTLNQVDEIIKSAFIFQTKIMKEEFDTKNQHFPSVRIPNFGLFYVPDYIKKRFKE